jgi:type IV pilus assembly protein PilE
MNVTPAKHPTCLAAPVRGFTAIELLIVMAVMALLAALAIPTYQGAIRKSRRSDATSAITMVMQAQERYRAASSAYTAVWADLRASDATANGYYTLSVVGTPTATGYSLQAAANSGKSQASDSGCQTLTVTVTRGQITYGSANASGTANTTDTCWPK